MKILSILHNYRIIQLSNGIMKAQIEKNCFLWFKGWYNLYKDGDSSQFLARNCINSGGNFNSLFDAEEAIQRSKLEEAKQASSFTIIREYIIK